MEAITLKKFAKDTIAKYPHLKNEVNDFLQLCSDEIEDGGSPTHERSLCYGSIQELIEEEEQKSKV